MEQRPDFSAVLPKGNLEEEERAHREVEALLSRQRMRAVLNAEFALGEELKHAKTVEHTELGGAYRRLEAAFQDVIIAEGEIQRGKE